MAKQKRKGETRRYTFRLPDDGVAGLDALVEGDREELGSATRTSALLRLIAQELARRAARKEKKKIGK